MLKDSPRCENPKTAIRLGTCCQDRAGEGIWLQARPLHLLQSFCCGPGDPTRLRENLSPGPARAAKIAVHSVVKPTTGDAKPKTCSARTVP